MNTNSNFSVESLYRDSYKLPFKTQISDLLKYIKESIKEANNKGHYQINYELPLNLDTYGLEPYDAQLIVFSSIIEELKKGKFSVTIINDHDSTPILQVSWPSQLDPHERLRMKKIIETCTIKHSKK